MKRSYQALRIGILCLLLFVVVGIAQEDANALGLCSMEYCDCTWCQCQGMITCCESVCGECWADINDPTSPNYLACDGGAR